ncbi:MAG: protein kinase [Planctomycetota bacterium]|nr:protein kinase [Planctomycetota bacterium]
MIDDLKIIDQACDRFEAAWKQDRDARPDLATYLQECGADLREQLLESLLPIELWWRLKLGESPKREEYEELAAEHEHFLDRVFDQGKESFASDLNRIGSLQTLGLVMDRAFPAEKDPWPTVHLRVLDSTSGNMRYQLLNVLGRGQFGVLFLAYDHMLRRQVAIKVLSLEVILQFGSVDRCLDEARTLSHLEHEGLIPVHDAGVTDDRVVYIVSHYVDGEDLSVVLKQRSFSIEETIDLVVFLARALDFAHGKGVVHRDLKPANILIERESHKVYLVDFGLAIFLADTNVNVSHTALAGTPAYMSPEQAGGLEITQHSDQYSLAVILYELLTGTLPIARASSSETIEAVKNQKIIPAILVNPQITQAVSDVCDKALAKFPSDRFVSMAQFGEALERCSPSHIALRKRNRRFAYVPIAALILVMLSLLVWVTVPPNKSNEGIQAQAQQSIPVPTTASALEKHGWRSALLVSRDGSEFRPAETLWPLRVGDSVKFEIALSRPAYVKIIWVGADGRAEEIYPNRTQSPTQPIQSLQSPSLVDSGWPLSGNPGMETAWILIDMDGEIQLTASDFDVKPRAFKDESYYRTIVMEMRSGDRILFESDGSAIRSLGSEPQESNDTIRNQLDKIMNDVDTIQVLDLPFAGKQN